MARRSSVETVIGSVVSALLGSTGVTDLVSTRVYNNVPQGSPFPYVEVSSPTDRPVDTFGRFGSSVLVDVKAVSQGFGDLEACRLTDQIVGVLNPRASGVTLATTGHTALGIAYENGERYREVIQGVVTRHHVSTFRVWTEQSS